MAIESELTGKVVLITGGAGGVGLAAARRFLEEGARVVLADVDPAALARASVELADAAAAAAPAAPPLHTVAADVTRVADCERMVAAAVAWGGRLDALVNAAGVWVEGPTELMTEADWDRVVDVNLKGTFFCCSRAIPELRKSEGAIVNDCSDAGVVGTPQTAIYTASKGGVSLLTKSLAIELAPDLVNVNAVCPADIDTPMLRGQARDFGGGDPDAYLRTLLRSYHQGDRARFIRADEVAETIVFLASAKAAPITGALISIDFGSTAGYGYA
jgi:NAD(P)-dependent dehydrogenase (short-subunit alcohol dehydrogenase family)